VTADGFWRPAIEMLVNMPLVPSFFVASDPSHAPPLTTAKRERSERYRLAALQRRARRNLTAAQLERAERNRLTALRRRALPGVAPVC
jgi:hypothetical protein